MTATLDGFVFSAGALQTHRVMHDSLQDVTASSSFTLTLQVHITYNSNHIHIVWSELF